MRAVVCLLLSTLTSAPGLAAANGAQEAPVLEVGRPVERELAGGQSHAYTVRLEAGQLVRAVVDQRGVDVVVALTGPDGATLVEVDGPSGRQGPEILAAVVERSGAYRLDVRALDPKAPSGRYEARLEEARPASAHDRDLVEADRLFGEADTIYRKGRFAEAIPVAERAVARLEAARGAEHASTVRAMVLLAILHSRLDDYAQAERLLVRALAIQEKALGPEHERTGEVVNSLAILYRATGDYAKAEPLHLRALGIAEKAFGPDRSDTAAAVRNLAGLYGELGDYTKAEPLYQRGVAINEKVYGPDHPRTATAINDLASVYHSTGAHAKAEPLYQRAIAIYEKAFGPTHVSVATTLNNLAGLYSRAGELAKAESIHRRVLTIVEKELGPDHSTTGWAFHSLGIVVDKMGDLAKGRALLERALAIKERSMGPEHPDTATVMVSVAGNYFLRREYAAARPLQERAVAIRERALGPDHPSTAEALHLLSRLYRATGEIARAVETQARANDVRERDLSRNLMLGSERRKLLYIAQSATELDATLSLHLSAATAIREAARLALEIVLRRKGRALDAMTDQLAALRRRAGPEDEQLLAELASARTQLSSLTLRGPGRGGPEAHRANLRSLADRVESLESQLAARSTQARASLAAVTLEAVRAGIPDRALLVEYAVYRPYDPTAEAQRQFGAPRYVAYTFDRAGEIRWVELDEAARIDAAIGRLREALGDPKRDDVRQLAREVDRLAMEPVRRLLGARRTVIVSPDGALNLVPFAALVDERGRYLVERYEIRYVTSGRDLMRLGASGEPRQPPLVVADPDYGEAGAVAAEGRGLELGSAAPPELVAMRFAPLRFTADEAEVVSSRLAGARVLVGSEATEVAIKQAPAPRVLHLATHGFFLEDLPAADGGERGLELGPSARAANPLLRSGLALAGANLRGGTGEDGILTAMEAAGLDLWGTKLVVLSACQTGVGEVRTGDGVYGLRRALVLAGSESQVMSLWSVADRATRDLMVAYYTRLERGEGRAEALRRVQRAMLGRRATSHPFFWASFIQSGAWSPLDLAGHRNRAR